MVVIFLSYRYKFFYKYTESILANFLRNTKKITKVFYIKQ